MNEKYNRMECNRCGRVFNFGESVYVKRMIGNTEIKERKCPHCLGEFHALEVPEFFDKFLYVDYDDRYYSYPDKREN